MLPPRPRWYSTEDEVWYDNASSVDEHVKN